MSALRRKSKFEHAVDRVGELPVWVRIVAVGAAVTAVSGIAYAARRRVWQGVALVADAVEEVADTVEDAAEDLADAARERAAAGVEQEPS